MANEVTEQRSTNVSEFLRKQSTGASFGNIDASDLKPPQLKLLAGQSPEVTDGIPGALPGNFWMTVLNMNLGPSVVGSPILLRKTYQVWRRKRPGRIRKGHSQSQATAFHGMSRTRVSRSAFPAILGPTLGSLAGPSRRQARTSSADRRTTTSHRSPLRRSHTMFCGSSICRADRSNCACSSRPARA